MTPYASAMLAHEARALLARLARVSPFALNEPMVPAAALLPSAQSAIERYLVEGRQQLHRLVLGFLSWLAQSPGVSAEEAQRRFALLRLQFNTVLTQFELFRSVVTQRSEHETGVWLSGLDVVSADALTLVGNYYRAPPVICYLDRGVGAAIRRARTRLPGGGMNPVAIIRVPRERMIGSGIASSLVHEVGHQAAALLGLVASLRPTLQGMQRGGSDQLAWALWERWISEVVADFWSIARLGVVSTLGLMGVVSLPRPFVFRLNADDPHPMPWLRVALSCEIGNALFPHPQWQALLDLWTSFYPVRPDHLREQGIFEGLRSTMPAFTALLINHRVARLRGRSLSEALDVEARQPARLARLYQSWCASPAGMYDAAPTLVFAVLGQARMNGHLNAEEESDVFAKLLTHWALRSTLDTSLACASTQPDAGLTRVLRLTESA
ncbi:hypothetical protein [Caballeronia sp. LZ035]|uniref:hypothetical protein n=1 Tax=Caballeronia sp. LZ035 TaxID=3038568 RepID=UPI00286440BA|nr:hypothetical protein [Caballeronia sp. LZ035]MDR5757125.1 hypothetical protein [Caballeronia sp. LZ035]